MGTGNDAGDEMAEEPAPMVPCDSATLDLPTGSAKGGACGDCLKKNCADVLTVCEDDCTCIHDEMCLIVNGNNYTHCSAAMADIGMGEPGLTALGTCLPHLCNSECNEAD